MNYLFVLDNRRMVGRGKIDEVKPLLKRLNRTLLHSFSTSKVSIISFADSPDDETSICINFTSGYRDLSKAIDNLVTTTDRLFFPTVIFAIQKMASRQGVLVLISSGVLDKEERYALSEIRRQRGQQIHVVGVEGREGIEEKLLWAISEKGGGRYFSPVTRAGIRGAFDDLQKELLWELFHKETYVSNRLAALNIKEFKAYLNKRWKKIERKGLTVQLDQLTETPRFLPGIVDSILYIRNKDDSSDVFVPFRYRAQQIDDNFADYFIPAQHPLIKRAPSLKTVGPFQFHELVEKRIKWDQCFFCHFTKGQDEYLFVIIVPTRTLHPEVIELFELTIEKFINAFTH